MLDTGETWNFHRRLIQPIFHASTLELFLGTYIDAGEMLVKRLAAGPTQLNITLLVNQCVIDVLNGNATEISSAI